MNPNYLLVAQRAKHQCEYCHAPEVIFNVAFEVDHIIPISKGGLDESPNWALACRVCNLRKLDYVDGFDPVNQQQVRLFNPRTDSWYEYFAVQGEAPFLLESTTSIGRATLDRLQMNAPLQLRARAQWITLGIFG
ncbi:HNH endonuclease [Coleofasciculus sp. H7-2]|uniref:HNH endonuclease n=1 Tax=Coleofasciculus sp. H7-2 TaxID=3351545 RepID=UPI003670FF8E